MRSILTIGAIKQPLIAAHINKAELSLGKLNHNLSWINIKVKGEPTADIKNPPKINAIV